MRYHKNSMQTPTDLITSYPRLDIDDLNDNPNNYRIESLTGKICPFYLLNDQNDRQKIIERYRNLCESQIDIQTHVVTNKSAVSFEEIN